YVGGQIQQFGRGGPRPLNVAHTPAIVDLQISTNHPSEFLEALLERLDASPSLGIVFGRQHQYADPLYPLLLCARGARRKQRRRSRRAAEQRDELAPPYTGHRAPSRSTVGRSTARSTWRRKAGKSLGQS